MTYPTVQESISHFNSMVLNLRAEIISSKMANAFDEMDKKWQTEAMRQLRLFTKLLLVESMRSNINTGAILAVCTQIASESKEFQGIFATLPGQGNLDRQSTLQSKSQVEESTTIGELLTDEEAITRLIQEKIIPHLMNSPELQLWNDEQLHMYQSTTGQVKQAE